MRQAKTNYIALISLGLFALAVIVCSALYIRTTALDPALYDESQPVAVAEIGTVNVSVPAWKLFHVGQMWSLVNATHMLAQNYAPELSTVIVAHAPQATEVAKRIEMPLNSLVTAASAEGVPLMLSSAYRSASDQQTVYDSLLTLRGSDYVHEYVAAPGASEHQTGLAVDFASVTHGCEINPNACSLDATAIAWLRAHAANYGFIERYPLGKQSITGVAGEHWHYRYVGVPLAKALTAAKMTLDEFVEQIAPGYSK